MSKKPRILGRQVHHTLFGEEVVEEPQDSGWGRNKETLAKRDERFAYRYDWYRRMFKNQEYTWYLERVAEEFDLRLYTAGWLLNNLGDLAVKAHKEALSERELRKRWWWMEWDVNKIPMPVITGK